MATTVRDASPPRVVQRYRANHLLFHKLSGALCLEDVSERLSARRGGSPIPTEDAPSRRFQLKNALKAEFGPMAVPGPYDKLLSTQRRKMFAAFAAFRGDPAGSADPGTDSILDVESRSLLMHAQSSILLAHADQQDRQRIVSCAIEPAADPGGARGAADSWMKYLRADGRHLPFADGEFDWVFGGEIIERSGSFERQYELLAELCRVARKGVFVTTSNLWNSIPRCRSSTGCPPSGGAAR
jgi:hypothetical protein